MENILHMLTLQYQKKIQVNVLKGKEKRMKVNEPEMDRTNMRDYER